MLTWEPTTRSLESERSEARGILTHVERYVLWLGYGCLLGLLLYGLLKASVF